MGDEKSPNPNAAKMTDLVVPNGFDYATTQDITLDVVLRDRSGAPLSHVRVDENEDEKRCDNKTINRLCEKTKIEPGNILQRKTNRRKENYKKREGAEN